MAYAAEEYFSSLEEITAMSRVLQTYALISAIIVAGATSFIVFRNARKMRGGIFGTVLNYFGIGMIVVLGGFVVEAYPSLIPVGEVGTVTNILFIIGYILMAVAATKLSKAIEGHS